MSNDGLPYPWQEVLREVLIETRPEQGMKKIQDARTLILGRLQEIAGSPTNNSERDAIIQAMRLLHDQWESCQAKLHPQPKTGEASRKRGAA